MNVETFVKKSEKYKTLPLSCSESAESLKRDRKYYEADGVFPERVIEGTISKLRSYRDSELRKKWTGEPGKIEDLLQKYI